MLNSRHNDPVACHASTQKNHPLDQLETWADYPGRNYQSQSGGAPAAPAIRQ